MARSRNLKPGFFVNDKLADVEPLGRLLFAGLWTIADREGRLGDRPRRIKAEILPYDDCDVDNLLNQLETHGFIQRYEVNGNDYIQILNFSKHQNPHPREAESEIPPVPEPAADKATPRRCPDKTKDMTSPADSPIPHPSSPIPSTPSSEDPDEEAKPKRKFEEGTTELALAGKLKAYILENNPNARVPTNLQKWAGDFDRMIRLDKRPIPEIEAVMEFSQRDSFWRSNILSAGKLREKYDQLYLKGKAKRASPQGTVQYVHARTLNELEEALKSKTMVGLKGGKERGQANS